MQGKQKTLESFDTGSGAERTGADDEALSMHFTQSKEKVTYDENIRTALERVVGNRGAPGIDGMSVFELHGWLQTNINSLKSDIREGKYIPTPVRRKEIPKPNGGVRNLGIPTVRGRLVQQMVAQVFEPIYEPTFSEHSCGFHPGLSTQDVILAVRDYYEQGYTVMVDLGLEKIFDNLNQDILMNILRERIKDGAVISLVKRFLRAGVAMPDGIVEPSLRGSPQGGPLSPLLSNIYLDSFDRLLESRGLRFYRYADDCVILIGSMRAGERVRDSCTRYLEGKLRLKVNQEKTKVGSSADLQFLGFNIIRSRNGEAWIVPSENMIRDLGIYVRGCFGYYGITDDIYLVEKLDGWMRRRVRQFILKKWKGFKTIVRNLGGLLPAEGQSDVRRPVSLPSVDPCLQEGCVRRRMVGHFL